jgi:hypothetical protein
MSGLDFGLEPKQIDGLNLAGAICKHLSIDRPRPFIGNKWEVIVSHWQGSKIIAKSIIFHPEQIADKPLAFYHYLKTA